MQHFVTSVRHHLLCVRVYMTAYSGITYHPPSLTTGPQDHNCRTPGAVFTITAGRQRRRTLAKIFRSDAAITRSQRQLSVSIELCAALDGWTDYVTLYGQAGTGERSVAGR